MNRLFRCYYDFAKQEIEVGYRDQTKVEKLFIKKLTYIKIFRMKYYVEKLAQNQ